MRKNNNKGFSLVELIIVIAIMAVLIGVLAPQFIKYVERSRESTDLQNIAEIKAAIEAAVADGEGLDSTTVIKIEVTGGTGGTAKVTGADDLDLTSYGIMEETPNKSAKWSTFSWEYKNYAWVLNPTNAAAQYFNADGTAYDGSAAGGGTS